MGRDSNTSRFEMDASRMSMRDQLGVRLIRMVQELRLQGLPCPAALTDLATRETERVLHRPPSG